MKAKFKLPGVRLESTSLFVSIIFFLLWAGCIVGYFMNFQNLWQYFPSFPADASLSDVFNLISARWIFAVIGVFAWPLGVVFGYIW